MVFLLLMLGTLVSEDLTCIAAGLLAHEGRIGVLSAIGACATGIFVGDVGLWAAGWICRTTLTGWSVSKRAMARWQLDQRRSQFENSVPTALLASRFVPGSRLPLYLAAGFSGVRLRTFATWTCLAVLLWTPILVLSAAAAGKAPLPSTAMGVGLWTSKAMAAGALIGLVVLLRRAASRCISWVTAGRFARWSRWEFWPMWLFYAPVTAWIGLLSLRYRSIATITAANPGIPDGGTVGESKFQILSQLPADTIIPSTLIEPGPPGARQASLRRAVAVSGWAFPLVLKPDVGQRGVGMKIVRNADEAAEYLRVQRGPVLAQPYHPGPFEIGIFYYRYPGHTRGRIFSMTDKHFPLVTGDGMSTLADLIRRHPRYRLQAHTFFVRHCESLDHVLPEGGRFQLAHAGNHAQGTLFRDGMHLWTEALERRIDEIAQSAPGFFVGRFDIRYADVHALRRGQDLAIVELNGATAESTDIYDPAGSLWHAYRRLCEQWSIVFAIGSANRTRGAHVSSMRRLIALVRAHLTTPIAFEISD
jgi:membrane protein DedA with SNARE-associated domain